jgi:AraC-like DNA-binding protein
MSEHEPTPTRPTAMTPGPSARPAEVATAVGFYDQAHFARHFKKHTSATPASYARSHER